MRIKRSIFKELVGQRSRPEISILLGARQVGKTFLMQELEETFRRGGEETEFLNLELPSHLREVTGTEESVYKRLTGKKGILFIDEFHYVTNASKIFKAIYDSRLGIKIFASGSSSIEMHKHLKESLAGRIWKNRIYPLTLQERTQDKSFDSEMYYQFGGLPGLVNEKEDASRIKLLEMIVETYISKDIKGLIKEENIRAFNHMLYLLAQYQGSVVTISSLAKEIGLSEPTVKKNLDILTQTYTCYSLSSFSRNLGNELKKSQKYYLYDLGIRNLLLKDFSLLQKRKDSGTIGETLVLQNIIYQLKGNMAVHFWRTKAGDEIDFIVLKNRIPYPIEVKTTLGKSQPTDGMKKFIDAYPEVKEGIIFCRDIKGVIQYKKATIRILPWEDSAHIHFMESVL